MCILCPRTIVEDTILLSLKSRDTTGTSIEFTCAAMVNSYNLLFFKMLYFRYDEVTVQNDSGQFSVNDLSNFASIKGIDSLICAK